MINLELLDACQNCPKFVAVSELEYEIMNNFEMHRGYKVTCENFEVCQALLEHLEKEEKKNG